MTVHIVHIPGHGVTEEKVPDLDVEVVYDPELGPLVRDRYEPQVAVYYELIEVRGVLTPVPQGQVKLVLDSIHQDIVERETKVGAYRVGDFSTVVPDWAEFLRSNHSARNMMGATEEDKERLDSILNKWFK
jgi:hypothetical protein